MRVVALGVHYGHFTMMLDQVTACEGADLVGVYDVDADKRTEIATKYGATPYDSAEAMFEAETPDMAIEGVCPFEKREVVEQCADAGVNLVLDKPLAVSTDDHDAMLAAVRRSGIKLSMYFTLRYWGPYLVLKQKVDSGELGRIVSVVTTHPHTLGPERRPEWMFQRNKYGGVLVDFTGHGIDFVRWLTGRVPVRVSARHGTARFVDYPGFEDWFSCAYTLADGSAATVNGDWLYAPEAPSFGHSVALVVGTHGAAWLTAWSENTVKVAAWGGGEQDLAVPQADLGRFFVELADAWSSGKEAPVSTADVFGVSRACLVARDSADQDGTLLDVPPE